MSAIAWYEFTRGPRTTEELAVAEAFLSNEDVIPFKQDTADIAAKLFRALGYPRKRGNDIAIGVTAALADAVLWTTNQTDFQKIPGLILGPD